MSFGWGTVLGFIFDRFPARKESLRNESERLKREMSLIQKINPSTDITRRDYERIAERLREVETKLKNS